MFDNEVPSFVPEPSTKIFVPLEIPSFYSKTTVTFFHFLIKLKFWHKSFVKICYPKAE